MTPHTADPVPSVQDCLGAAGDLPRVTANGVTYTVGFPTQRAKARLEELIAASAVSEVVALKGVLDTEPFADMLAEVRELVRAREHRVGGRLWAETVASCHGGLLYLLALLREHHPGVTEADTRALLAAEPEQVAAALDRVTPCFVRVVAAGAGATTDQTAAALARLTPSTPASASPG